MLLQISGPARPTTDSASVGEGGEARGGRRRPIIGRVHPSSAQQSGRPTYVMKLFPLLVISCKNQTFCILQRQHWTNSPYCINWFVSVCLTSCYADGGKISTVSSYTTYARMYIGDTYVRDI